jgi:hypothetical protein
MSNDDYLSSAVRISDYRQMEKDEDREKIAAFFLSRYTERYITPVESTPRKQKHGFAIMALSCLLMETLESFWQGLENTDGRSQKTFKEFIQRCEGVAVLRGKEVSFFKGVRCGILHQGETTLGWRLTRRKGPLFEDKDGPILNATLLHQTLKREMHSYAALLRAGPWGHERWRAFRTKMDAICKNCSHL